MATIREKAPYQWQVQIRRMGWPNQNATFRTKKDAEAWARKAEAQMDRGLFVDQSAGRETTLGDLVELYLTGVTAHRPSANAQVAEKARLKRFQRDERALCSYAAVNLKPEHFEDYRDRRLKHRLKNGKTIAPGTVKRELTTLMPKSVQDVDGNEQDRRGTVSVFNGPDPEIQIFADAEREIAGVTDWIKQAVDAGIAPAEIGIFVRSNDQLARARAAVKAAGHTQLELSERLEQPKGRVAIGTMHLAKGLEYKAVAVMACDDDVLPLQERIETVADESELDEVHDTERNLFYVACTRARDRLLVTGVAPASEFFADFQSQPGANRAAAN